MKKSYNLFKMRGSYVGAFITLLSLFLVNEVNFFREIVLKITPEQVCYITLKNLVLEGIVFCNPLLVVPYFLVGGFLIGWGIHSLFRRFR